MSQPGEGEGSKGKRQKAMLKTEDKRHEMACVRVLLQPRGRREMTLRGAKRRRWKKNVDRVTQAVDKYINGLDLS